MEMGEWGVAGPGTRSICPAERDRLQRSATEGRDFSLLIFVLETILA